MTKAMTVSERRKAKKAHAEFVASMAQQPGQEGQVSAFIVAPKAAPERMKPTVQARSQAAYEEVAADTKGAKHFRRKIACLLDLLESKRTITRQECEAGKRYEADHRLVWGTSGRDSCIPPAGGVVHETEAQAERVVRAKARMTKVLAKAGPAAFALLRQVAAYEQPLGKQNTKAQVERYGILKAALTSIRQWAERFDCAVCIVAHPTKMQAVPGARPSPPLGYDISDSAAWFNKAAIGCTVHQVDGDDPHVSVINWKSKFQQQYGIGKGKIALDFDPRAMTYRKRMHG